jgi:competence protein ComEC
MVTDRRILAPVLLALVVMLAGCGVLGGGTPTAKATPPPSTDTPTATSTGTPTANATPTLTPTVEGTPLPTPTKVSPTGIRVVTVSEEGDALNDEYIVIKNTGGNFLDLSGWSVKDGDGHVHTFQDGVTLEVGQTLTLYSGQGSQQPANRYWWADEMIWDDDGEKITIFDDTGQEVYNRTYT